MITHLVFSGAGVKSLAYLGSLQLLVSSHYIHLQHVQCFVGSSSGALVAMMLSIGYTVRQMTQLFFSLNIERYQSLRLDLILTKMGLDDGKRILTLLAGFLIAKQLSKNITFSELYEKTGKTLIMTGTNITLSRCEYFSHMTTPDMPVLLALRISMCYPFVFQPVLYNKCYYVDGALLDDFPIKYLHTIMGINKDNIFGLLIHEKILNENRNNVITDLETFGLSLIHTIIDHSICQCCNGYENNYLQIDIESVNPVDLSLNDQTKQYIYQKGIQCTQSFLHKRNHTNTK